MSAVERGVLAYWHAWRHRPVRTAIGTILAFAMAVTVLAYGVKQAPHMTARASSPHGKGQAR